VATVEIAEVSAGGAEEAGDIEALDRGWNPLGPALDLYPRRGKRDVRPFRDTGARAAHLRVKAKPGLEQQRGRGGIDVVERQSLNPHFVAIAVHRQEVLGHLGEVGGRLEPGVEVAPADLMLAAHPVDFGHELIVPRPGRWTEKRQLLARTVRQR